MRKSSEKAVRPVAPPAEDPDQELQGEGCELSLRTTTLFKFIIDLNIKQIQLILIDFGVPRMFLALARQSICACLLTKLIMRRLSPSFNMDFSPLPAPVNTSHAYLWCICFHRQSL
jgi:hypothetical protein